MTKHYRAAFFFSCCVIIFLLLREPPCFNKHRAMPLKRVRRQLTGESIYVYKGYLDRRMNLSYIRVLALNKCKARKNSTSFLSVFINNAWHQLAPLTVESGCPWGYAKGCSLVPQYHEVAVPRNFTNKEVLFRSAAVTQKLELFEVQLAKKEGFTVCVPPIYWYTDWVKLLVFIEYWRVSGATHFVFYHHSSTEDVKKVFDYYAKEKWMSIVPWPLLPTSDDVDPNEFVYRIAHSIAHNDCMLRAETNRAVLLDVDELIYSMNGSLPSLMQTHFTTVNGSSVGGLLFSHSTLQYDPPLNPISDSTSPFDFEKVDFQGVLNPKYSVVKGPTKVIFDPSAVKRLGVHGVTQYLNSKRYSVQLTPSRGLLLHNRFNYKELTGNSTQTSFSLVPGDASNLRETLVRRRKEIFPDGASFNPQVQEVLSVCIEDWRKKQHNCKNPVEGCRFLLQPMEKWVEATEDVYTIF